MTEHDAEQYDFRAMAMQEYVCINDTITKYDDIKFKIKSWSITVSSLAIGAAYTEDKKILLLLGSISPIIFWLTESLFAKYKQVAIDRSLQIEEQIRGSLADYTGPNLSLSYVELSASAGIAPLLRATGRLETLLPHVIIADLGLALYVWETWN